jgi:hypothetical protein
LEASTSDELEVVAALHRLGADLGDPVEVAREQGRIVVRGSGIPQARQQQIREALLPLANVEVQFPTVPHAPAQTPQTVITETPPTAPSVPSRLEAQFAEHTQFESFSAQLLELQESAMARVYALRRLANEFPADTESQLAPASRHLLRDLSREHLEALNRTLTAIFQQVRPVLAGMGATAQDLPPAISAANWQQAAEALFLAARQEDALLATLLGAAPGAESTSLPKKLSGALSEVERAMQRCQELATM